MGRGDLRANPLSEREGFGPTEKARNCPLRMQSGDGGEVSPSATASEWSRDGERGNLTQTGAGITSTGKGTVPTGVPSTRMLNS